MAINFPTNCAAEASKAAGRDLTDDELDALFTRAQSRVRRYVRQGMSPYDAAGRAGQELGAEIKLAAAVEARSAKINLIAQKGLKDRTVDGREYDSLMATITGIEKARQDTLIGALKGKNIGTNFYGAADSVDARGNAAVGQVLGAMDKEIRAAGLRKALLKGDKQFSRDLANELGRLNDPNWGKASGNKFAAKAAEIIGKYLEDTRLMQNKAGAWIGKLDQYVTRQSHDADKIRGDGTQKAYAKWRDVIEPKLDERTFLDHDAPVEREAYLHEIWKNLSTGNHEGATGADWLSGFKGPANLARRVSADRKLFFKSADDWFDYNEAFGHGDVRASVYKQIEHGARNAAIMRVMGTNPENMLKGWISKLIRQTKDRGDVNQGTDIENHAGKFSGILDYAMRKGAGSEVPTFTRIMAVMRSLQDFKLGGPLSYLSDLGTIGGVARQNDINLFESYANSVAALLPRSQDFHDLASDLGAGQEGFSGSLIAHMRSYDGLRGQVAAMASTYESLNGVKYWVQHEKEGLGIMLSHNLARNSSKAFDKLGTRLQKTLLRYGIDAPEWHVIKDTQKRLLNDRIYLVPSDVRALDDKTVLRARETEVDALEQYHADRLAKLKSQDAIDKENATHDRLLAEMAERTRGDLFDKLSNFFQDQVRVGLSEPTAGISHWILGPKTAATAQSEVSRAFWQFKTFPMTHVLRSLTRELFRDGLDVGGVAHLIASTSLLGYAAYSLKKLTRGQIPATPTSQSGLAASVMEGVAQGGGLGIYGDFLFGQKSRWGSDALSELLGPTYSEVNQAAGVVIGDLQNAAKGNNPAKGWARELATQGIDFGKRNGPMVNLWYARAALDYLILYSLQETVNPGYLHRYEQQLIKDQGVQFYAKPSTAHVRTFGR